MTKLKKTIFAAFFLLLGVILTARLGFTDQVAAEVKSQSEYGITPEEAQEHSTFAVVTKRAMPAVVSIKVERSVEYQYTSPFDQFFNNDPFEDFFGNRRPQQPKSKKFTQQGQGSGFIYTTDGYIMTNNHVVEKADNITVKLNNGHELKAEVIGTDPETDLAVIKVDQSFKPEEILQLGNSDNLWAGDWVIAIGSPYSLEKTVTVGIVSAKGRSGLGIDHGPSFQDFIQTDAAINPGNSGGPLLDIKGRVVGINAAVNAQAQGIGFAIPINMANRIQAQLKDKGSVTRGFIGIGLREITSEEKAPYGLKEDDEGILVTNVDKNTPAEKAGIKADDIIVALNGSKIVSTENFRFTVASFAPGTEIKLTILREGGKKDYTVKLADRNEFFGIADKKDGKPEDSWIGLVVRNVTENDRRNFRLDDANGVIVTEVTDKGRAAGKLAPNDIITKFIVAGRYYDIASVSDFNKFVKEMNGKKDAFVAKVNRNGMNLFIVIK